MIKGYNAKGEAILSFEGKYYTLVNEAYLENYQGETAVFQNAITGEKDEYGDYVIYRVRWNYIEAEDMENVADWGNPEEITL